MIRSCFVEFSVTRNRTQHKQLKREHTLLPIFCTKSVLHLTTLLSQLDYASQSACSDSSILAQPHILHVVDTQMAQKFYSLPILIRWSRCHDRERVTRHADYMIVIEHSRGLTKFLTRIIAIPNLKWPLENCDRGFRLEVLANTRQNRKVLTNHEVRSASRFSEA